MNKRNGYKLGSPFGIGVYVHWTFGLLILWVLFSSISGGLGGTIFTLALICALFGCVVLHELGHSLAARFYGIPTRDITLYPIGGVASLERMPEDPKQELVIALAGPAVNVAIAILLAPVALFANFILPEFLSRFVATLMVANIILVVFNMIPAFPMDGGRVLRALLAKRRGYVPATVIASKVGQALAVAFGIYALFSGQLMLALIAGFVFLTAGAERRMVAHRAFFNPRSGVMPTPPPFVREPAGVPVPTVVIREDEWEVLPPKR